ncbi:MAG TPA: hypothetical protein VGO89_18410, partial [Streptomyces sp.]|nr:hypothetical protein [Streptomyces sp.]
AIAAVGRAEGRSAAEGQPSTDVPEGVTAGDWVLLRGAWQRVREVGESTVTVPSAMASAPLPWEAERVETVAWRKVREHRRSEEMPPKFIDLYEAPGAVRLCLKPEDWTFDSDGER